MVSVLKITPTQHRPVDFFYQTISDQCFTSAPPANVRKPVFFGRFQEV